MTTTSSSKTFSLVKYDTPILVSKAFGKNRSGINSNISSATTSAGSNRSKDQTSSMRTEDYLNSILPPREY